jgi:hypothetical protein
MAFVFALTSTGLKDMYGCEANSYAEALFHFYNLKLLTEWVYIECSEFCIDFWFQVTDYNRDTLKYRCVFNFHPSHFECELTSYQLLTLLNASEFEENLSEKIQIRCCRFPSRDFCPDPVLPTIEDIVLFVKMNGTLVEDERQRK